MTTPQNSAEVVEALTPTLDRFVLASTPMLRDCAEAVYEQLLYSVQDYLKSNAEWNIGAEIDRCRKIELENIELRATIHQLGENAAKAAGEYAEEVGRLREALEDTQSTLSAVRASALAAAGASDLKHIYHTCGEQMARNRAALTEPTDEG